MIDFPKPLFEWKEIFSSPALFINNQRFSHVFKTTDFDPADFDEDVDLDSVKEFIWRVYIANGETFAEKTKEEAMKRAEMEFEIEQDISLEFILRYRLDLLDFLSNNKEIILSEMEENDESMLELDERE